MAGPYVWLCVLVTVVAADLSTTPASPPDHTSQVENCQGDTMSSLMKTAGCSPACVASSLALCSQYQEQNQFAVFVEEMREFMQELRTPMRPCSGRIIEESESRRPRHCQDLLEEGDSGRGVRQVYPYPGMPHDTADVYCDHTVDGGGWTVWQRRMNASSREDFYRTWTEYQLGFGNLTGEFWIGLDLLHVLTSSSLQQLRIELADYEGEQRWAKYGVFKVGPPEDNYRLTVGRYTGDAGDSLIEWHNDMQFSTHDADHDTASSNCAVTYKGAWWYEHCHASNLNGYQYEGHHESYADGIIWYHWKGHHYSLLNTTLMIKPGF